MLKKKKLPVVQWQNKNWNNYKEKRTSQKYWDWVNMNWSNRTNRQMTSEPYRANPDRHSFENENSSFSPNFRIEDVQQFLTEKQYEIIVSRFKYRTKFSEIAKQLQSDPSTIRGVYATAIKKIKQYLENLEDSPEVS